MAQKTGRPQKPLHLRAGRLWACPCYRASWCHTIARAYTRDGITRWRNVHREQAAQQLAAGEFHRYDLRGLCLRAQAEGKDTLIVYRGKEVHQPRPESDQRIGPCVAVDTLLRHLRTNDFITIEAALGIPGGSNSGLTARLS